MPLTLRRSCAACAKAKHACDLGTPRCARCAKRKTSCVYANEPLNSTASPVAEVSSAGQASHEIVRHSSSRSFQEFVGRTTPGRSGSGLSITLGGSFDPFDSYPPTSLPRQRVQGLIHHFLSKIAFQYYPLDVNPESNPFLVSWWPTALTDPALFHVSLQTASLDDELHAQKGFPHSEILMNDCVALTRRKVQVASLASQDATMNVVVTLAAIEHGKGNLEVSQMHIEGVKKMVEIRGGLFMIKETSPLTARMVPWVAMLVMGVPQFETQDDLGFGDGISTIPQWQASNLRLHTDPGLLDLSKLGVNPEIGDILSRLRVIFHRLGPPEDLSTTDLHDLTCFVLHRLLLLSPFPETNSLTATISECIRYATAIYMFMIHGPTYYSHAAILYSLVSQLKAHVQSLISSVEFHDPLSTWFLSIGLVASAGTDDNTFFVDQARALSAALGMQDWEDVMPRLQSVLWLPSRCGAQIRHAWESNFASNSSNASYFGWELAV